MICFSLSCDRTLDTLLNTKHIHYAAVFNFYHLIFKCHGRELKHILVLSCEADFPHEKNSRFEYNNNNNKRLFRKKQLHIYLTKQKSYALKNYINSNEFKATSRLCTLNKVYPRKKEHHSHN